MDLQHRLTEAGHILIYPDKTLMELKMNVSRIARAAVRANPDAWIVASASAEVLEWFEQGKKPALALFGNWRGLSMAAVGPDKGPATAECTRRLINMGHRRIVLLVRRQHRQPKMGLVTRAFVETMAAHGFQADSYFLPDWEETVPGFQRCLSALFQITPPTALIVDEPNLFAATYYFLAVRGLRIPQDVSLVYIGTEPVFDWCVPAVSHIDSDYKPLARHVLRWAKNVSRGKRDLRQHILATKFVTGGSIALARNTNTKR
jgi:LacI family transcriptional regulator